MLERKFQSSIAAHRLAGYCPFRLYWEVPLDDGRELDRQRRLISGSMCGVGIEPSSAVGHHKEERQLDTVALHGRAPHPNRVIVRKAVEEHENRVRRLEFGIGQHD